jgi:Tol biopolymer transport system component
VYVMRADGTHPRALTKLGNVSAAPAWSPDGTRLAFQSNADARLQRFEIYTIGLNGKGLHQLTLAATDIFEPAWSPDGKTLAFSRDGAIWVDTGAAQTQLTSGENDSSPAWRPIQPK